MIDGDEDLGQSLKSWTVAEKQLLLKGLKKFGPDNIDKIKDMIPEKSLHSIKLMISKYKLMAKLDTHEISDTLLEWLNEPTFQDDDPIIAKAFQFIQLYEDHPPPEETAGFDLKKFYEFLYHILMGNQPIELPPRTASMFKELQKSVDEELWPHCQAYAIEYLSGVLGKKSHRNGTRITYERK